MATTDTNEQPPKLNREDHDLHGEWSPESEDALVALHRWLASRKETDRAGRFVLSKLLLVPDHEEKAFMTEVNRIFRENGFKISDERRGPDIVHLFV